MLVSYILSILISFSLYSSSFSALDNVDQGSRNASGNKNTSTGDWVPVKWLSDDLILGQIGGITVDKNDTIYIFHRADRRWTGSTFNLENVYLEQYKGPINESTIIMIDKTGHVVKRLGERIFYMPHGITVDNDFNIWVTDVALHQTMKFNPSSNDAVLIKGTRFVPGKDSSHFCKPAAIAVLQNGDFFVADGYCNSRIVKFDSNGKKILEWGRSSVYPEMRKVEPGEFYIPHALTLTRDENLLCVADRENGRVQCFHPANGTYSPVLSNMQYVGQTVYSVAYSNYKGGTFVVVNGPEMFNRPVQGAIVSTSGEILNKFGLNLRAPHDVAVSTKGDVIYVAEITTDGTRAWKFVRNLDLGCGESTQDTIKSEPPPYKSDDKGLAGAILITSACLIFSVAIIFSAIVYQRSKTQVAKDTVSLLPHSDL